MTSISIRNTTPIGASVSEILISLGLNREVASLLYPYAYGTGPLTLKSKAQSAPSRGAFSCLSFYYGGWRGQPSGWPVLGPVLATHVSPPPKPLTEVADSNITKESEMSHDTPKGTPPKIRPINSPTPEILQGVLAELEASADLVEQLLTQGNDPAILDTVRQSLRAMTDLLGGGE